MGTRGFYAFKYRGKYYVYFNSHDSYPDGLGHWKASKVPSEPEAYRKWLEDKRQEYAVAEAKLAPIYCVSATRALTGQRVEVRSLGAQDLERIPLYCQPKNDLFIEWLYIFDLDLERFSVNNCCHFQLSKLPKDWRALLSDAKNFYFSSSSAYLTHPSITTNVVVAKPSESDPRAQYVELRPTLVKPKIESKLNKKPVFTVCRSIFANLHSQYQQYQLYLWEARATLGEADFLFREVAFTLLCLASCSPELVRIATRVRVHETVAGSPFAFMNAVDESTAAPEFASALFEGYHLTEKAPGSSPSTTSYWLKDVLVLLRCDLQNRSSFRQAIIDAVQQGRDDGRTDFHAVVLSITHAVLIRVTPDLVQHSRRLIFSEAQPVQTRYTSWALASIFHYNHPPNDDEVSWEEEQNPHTATTGSLPSRGHENSGECEDDWVNPDVDIAFEAIAHLFDAAATQKLRASPSQTHGNLPNEIYQAIIQYVDADTNQACLSVSRAFREYASDTFFMSDNLRLERSVRNKEHRLLYNSHECLGPFRLAYEEVENRHCSRPRHQQVNDEVLCWHPVVGFRDGSASFMSLVWLQPDREILKTLKETG